MKDKFEIKIEHGIPITSLYNSELTKSMKQMKVGDSFRYPESSRNNAASVAHRLNMKVTVHKIGGGMVRVWRVK